MRTESLLRCAPVLALLVPAALMAQEPAATFRERLTEVVGLSPIPNVADVNDLVITRDVGRLTLERGKLYLLSRVGGRTVGAVFRGQGRFTFTPPNATERAQLERFAGSPALDDTISEATFIFSDSMADQLAGLSFTQAEIPGAVTAHVADLVASLQGEKEGTFDGGVMEALLNGERTGFFLAHLTRARGDPVLFQFDPRLSESVQLHRPVGRLKWGTSWQVVTQFTPQQALPGVGREWRWRHRMSVPTYRVDVRLTPTFGADLDFAAQATLTVVPHEPVGPWLLFGLHPKLQIDSARWSDGTAVVQFKAKDSGTFWVRAGRRLKPGDTLALTVSYHGKLIDRFDNWFFIDPGADWWPTNGQGRDYATFDVTYHSPSHYPLASVGDRTDSTVAGNVLTTRWITRVPTPFATFNLGLFESHRVQHPGAPPLDVLISEDAHRLMRRQVMAQGGFMPQQRNMRENVAADMSNSLKWFTHLFGAPPYEHFYVTEIPYSLGVSFPGVIHLSWVTFQNTSLEGFDEYFRAHEAAHQWWGNGVRPASYRDAWLAEGLASFSGLWYLQTLRKRNDEYFKFLDQYAGNIRTSRRDMGPIWIGYRNGSATTPAPYHVTVYEKGAWVFHMLRTLMLDLQTMKEDRFTGMMQDFYASYRGKAATTEDFQRVVERHAGIPMDWFFDQWVKGTAIPTYRVAWTTEPADGGKYRVRFRVTQEDAPPDFQMWVLVSADLGNNRFANFRVGVKGGQTDYVSPLLPGRPVKVIFNELRSVLADVKMERW